MVRITGIACLVLTPLIVTWLMSVSMSGGVFDVVDGLMRSVLGDVILIAGAWALIYHMLGRLRHVVWDFGYGLDVAVSEKMAIGMFAVSTILTAMVAIFL